MLGQHELMGHKYPPCERRPMGGRRRPRPLQNPTSAHQRTLVMPPRPKDAVASSRETKAEGEMQAVAVATARSQNGKPGGPKRSRGALEDADEIPAYTKEHNPRGLTAIQNHLQFTIIV